MFGGREAGGAKENCAVAGVEGWAEEQDGGDAADDMREMGDYGGMERAGQEGRGGAAVDPKISPKWEIGRYLCPP